jgi:hypothetical protein
MALSLGLGLGLTRNTGGGAFAFTYAGQRFTFNGIAFTYGAAQ